jgi:nitrogen fixation/metabolism regulation signal transduction histidine kinase
MKRKIAVGVLSAVLLVGGATAAFGADAVDATKLDEIKNLTQQMFGIQRQIVEKEVEANAITQEQADKIKESIDQRQQYTEEALANGTVPGMGMNKRGGMKNFNNGEPMTAEQITAWVEQAQERLKAQEEAMRSAGKLTDEQIKTWVDAAQAQLKVQEEAMQNGTFVGGMGMPGGKGMQGGKGMHGGFAGQTVTPEASSTSTNS